MTQIVFGIHAVEACLRQAPEHAGVLHYDPRRRDRRLQALLDLARRQGVKLRSADADTLQRLSEGG
ncbi:MAG TPA: 23S rRNA (guanosine(2251)-2'-O)-methyltransferase RlmB, partial [Chromatiales bacterium]|nr:23S rRNA (guanosine(2251)-2'-O)-methyltransferase RlmB [Chromatiales bacterium]